MSEAESEKRQESQSDLLLKLVMKRYDLIAGDNGRRYAVELDGPNVALPLRGAGGLREALAAQYVTRHGRVPSSQALTEVLTAVEGFAARGAAAAVHLRAARHGGNIVIDLGTPDGQCVIVSPGHWRLADRSPVLFRRTRLTAVLPQPVKDDGGLEALAELFNIGQDGWRLLVGWLLAALIPDMPHPILALMGEQGTAKSTAARLLVDLIDPSPAPLRTVPRDIKQWAITANASWAVALDNVSTVPAWLSDTLCKAVTGDGIVDRALYTDDDVSVLAFRRVVAMTTIDAGALRGDLAERLLPVQLERIPDEQRRTDAEITGAYEDLRPAALGNLLTILSAVLVALPVVHLEAMPRMADFARVLAALDEVTGWNTTSTYAGTADEVAEAVIESDPFADAIRKLTEAGDWTGTAAELHERITPERAPKGWPSSARAASGALRRCAPALRRAGVEIMFHPRSATRGKARLITITDPQADSERKQPSSPSSLSSTTADQQERDDGCDDDSSCDDGRPSSTVRPSSQPSSPNRAADQQEHKTDDGDDGDDGRMRLESVSGLGPCTRCGRTHHRYGPGGHALCTDCRQREAS